MNYWAIAFPSLAYLASIGTCLSLLTMTLLANATKTVTGILRTYHNARGDGLSGIYDTTYLAICVSLNVLLSLMIIVRLALHSRNIRKAIGTSSGLGSLYTAVITMLVESSALNAVGYLLCIVTASADSFVAFIFSPPLGEIQVISLFLIVLRVTNRSALTSEAVASGNVSTIRFRTGGGSTGGPMSSHGEISGRLSVVVEIGSQET